MKPTSLLSHTTIVSHSHLVESLGLEPLAQNLSDSGQVRNGLVAHGLGHEVAVLLRSGRHLGQEDGGLWRRRTATNDLTS